MCVVLGGQKPLISLFSILTVAEVGRTSHGVLGEFSSGARLGVGWDQGLAGAKIGGCLRDAAPRLVLVQ